MSMGPSGLPKTVLATPTQTEASGSSPSSGVTSNAQMNSSSSSTPTASVILNRLKFNAELSERSKCSALLKEDHNKRMKLIRKELEYIEETAWKYQPIEDFIGS